MKKARERTDREILKLQRELSRFYSKAEKSVDKTTQRFAESIKEKADSLLQAIEEAEDTKDKRKAKADYQKFFLSVTMSKPFRDMCKESAEILYRANVQSFERINDKTASVYTDHYNATAEDLGREFKNEFLTISEEEAEKYGQITETKIDKRKDTSWSTKLMTSAVISAAFMGYTSFEVLRYATKRTVERNRKYAQKHASDILTDAETKGRLDSMCRTDDEGFETRKKWVCTLDNRTRATHRLYDSMGSIPLDEEWAEGLSRPRDPNGSPDEIENCRCELIYDVGQAIPKTRAARSGTVTGTVQRDSSFAGTRTVIVPYMTYREWMKWRMSNSK